MLSCVSCPYGLYIVMIIIPHCAVLLIFRYITLDENKQWFADRVNTTKSNYKNVKYINSNQAKGISRHSIYLFIKS